MSNNIYEITKQSCIICNSCRYCEGLCAVFPAMEKKRDFELTDIDYLANLCHQCSECFYDCQYAPPHEFNVALPKQLAGVRIASYEKYATPRIFGKAFRANAWVTTIVLLLVLFMGFGFAGALNADGEASIGDFFHYIPEVYMIGIFGSVSLLVLFSIIVSSVKFSRAIELKGINLAAMIQSLKDVLSMRYMGGHASEGCTYPSEFRSNIRRVFHHLTMYGFIFCFIATSLGAFYSHFLGDGFQAPYLFSDGFPRILPKLFGTIGGVMLCFGVLGLFILKIRTNEYITDSDSIGMDYAFLAMLFIVSAGGLALMALRESEYLAFVLYFHLSSVLALFIMLPFSKFIHLFYRFIALLKYNIDEQEH